VSARIALVAGFLCGLALLAACAGALYWLLLTPSFPLTQLEIRGELKNASRAEIARALPRAAGNFFAADLAQVRDRVEQLPWVRRVAVRRVWPARLEITVEEHVALARWGNDRLVNTFGETFSAHTTQALPSFVAPGGTAAEVVRRYRRFNELVTPLGTSVERVVLTQRHAWQLRLGNGLHVMLGRDADLAEERLARFVQSYPATVEKTRKRHDYVDLRYPNGFALRVPDGSG
jgi:cell division protein FtsQ